MNALTTPNHDLSRPVSANPKPNEEPSQARILIIDDTRAIHDDFRKILAPGETSELDDASAALFGPLAPVEARCHFDLESAYQGLEGVDFVQQALVQGRPYAMAFVDVRMPPGCDGLETTSKIWASDPDLQIVLCTAYSDYSWKDIAKRLGRSDNWVILKKPFDNIEVLQLAHALTQKWFLTQQLKGRLASLDVLVRERTRELSESEGNYRSLVEGSPEAFFVHREAKFIYANAAGLKLLGAERLEQLTGRPVWDIIPSDCQDAIRHRIQQATERGVVPLLLQKVVQLKGTVIEVEATSLPFRYEGKPAVQTVMRDVTERTRLETQLRQAQKMEVIGQLAGGVAHDFNNLLTVIRGNCELMLEAAKSWNTETSECLHQVIAAANRAADLTRQLLVFGREQNMRRRPVNLNEVMRNFSKMVKRIISEDIQLQCTYASALPCVQADIGMIEQVLMNLVVNARDAMTQGGQLRMLTESLILDSSNLGTHREAREGAFVCMSVRDSGAGIEPAHLSHLFEPFFTTKEVGKGTGLGLATAYGIVRQHEGWIDVVSQKGMGSTFRVFLPVTETPILTPT